MYTNISFTEKQREDEYKLYDNLKSNGFYELFYQAINEDEASRNLARFKETWGKMYPSCVKSWEENWDILSTFFAYPAEVRRIIYTTNIIEGLNRQFRSITKSKPSFTNDDSLRKMLYLASKKIVEHWTVRCRNWDQVLNQLEILFSDQNAG
jgi:transposase-like protein